MNVVLYLLTDFQKGGYFLFVVYIFLGFTVTIFYYIYKLEFYTIYIIKDFNTLISKEYIVEDNNGIAQKKLNSEDHIICFAWAPMSSIMIISRPLLTWTMGVKRPTIMVFNCTG